MAKETDARPKIAYVMTPITFGGAERVNLNFLRRVDSCRATIVPILFLRPWEDENFFVSELKAMGYDYGVVPVARANKREPLRLLRCVRTLLRIIRAHGCTLVHTHGYLADLIGYPVAKMLRLPIISTCHGFIHADWKLSTYIALDFLALRHFDAVVAVSGTLREELVRRGVNPEKVKLIENTPDITLPDAPELARRRLTIRTSLGISPREILVGFIGRLSREKGINYLLEAVFLLKKEGMRVTVALIGDGPEKERLRKLAAEKGIGAQIVFAGFQKDVGEWLPGFDLFVLPSLTEGTPMVLLEAMGYGLPCIASAVGGIPRVVTSGLDALLVQPESPEELRAAISDLGQDHLKRGAIGENARQRIVRSYDLGRWTEQILEEYRTLSRKRGGCRMSAEPEITQVPR